jgi:hypothetical protein
LKTNDVGIVSLPLIHTFGKYDSIVQKFNLDFTDFSCPVDLEVKDIEPPISFKNDRKQAMLELFAFHSPIFSGNMIGPFRNLI